MKLRYLSAALVLCLCRSVFAWGTLEPKPDDPFFSKFQPAAAPKAHGLMLHKGDSLAICGDSITEQRLYCRYMETYLTVVDPELGVTVRQFGWSGEQAPGFLARMTNDVLRFKPNVATTCYGMNDHHYRPYDPSIGAAYQFNMTAIVDSFKAAGTRVVIGAPGCMGLKPSPWNWVKGTPEDRNLNLCELRNIDVKLAKEEHTRFADVFWTMYKAEFAALQKWGPDYMLAGKDDVHPGKSGHLVMAYAFLKALGLPGDVGTITVNLKGNKASASKGHTILSCENGTVKIESSRYPFCAGGPVDSDNSIRSGMALVPFNKDLNRFMLVVRHGSADNYKVTWGEASHDYTSKELKKGVNLADDFPVNPFSAAFARVDEAVAKKQAFETKQIKEMFHGAAGKADMEKAAAESEQERASLMAQISSAFVPVEHTLTITPE